MVEWLCYVSYFAKVFLLLFFSLKHNSLSYKSWDYCWKYKFDIDVKIEQKIIITMITGLVRVPQV